MSLLDSIERIQRAPAHKRKTILAVSVVIAVIMIIGLWFLQLGIEFSSNDTGEKKDSIVAPFQLIWHTFTTNVKGVFTNLK